MSLRNRLPLILLVVSLTAMVCVGIGLFLWLDGVKETEARQLHGNLDNGAGRIQSEISVEFAAITALFTYTVEEKESITPEPVKVFLPDLTKLVPLIYEKWLSGTRFPDLIDTILMERIAIY